MILQDSVEMNATGEDVFAFFEGLDQERYLDWHPDHKLFRWTSGQGLQEGNTCYFEEVIAGKLLKKEVRYTRIVPNTHIEFAPTFWLMRLLLPRLVFRVEALGPDQIRFIAEIVVRTGPVGTWLNRREFDAVREHMRVEGINLKRFAEASHQEKQKSPPL